MINYNIMNKILDNIALEEWQNKIKCVHDEYDKKYYMRYYWVPLRLYIFLNISEKHMYNNDDIQFEYMVKKIE